MLSRFHYSLPELPLPPPGWDGSNQDDPTVEGVHKWKLHFCNCFYQSLLKRANSRLAFELLLQLLLHWSHLNVSRLLSAWRENAGEEKLLAQMHMAFSDASAQREEMVTRQYQIRQEGESKRRSVDMIRSILAIWTGNRSMVVLSVWRLSLIHI
eukprot:TRINITY_DN22480_c0_g1_i1.p1 TRINITY_DN22480_c0_g1~~TRINITY_DN22480_c0_g1_i1.p1  ORF type:complete len:154 (-),score=28.84 TRINITY_DN22480_c0_g1_i1:140-601(-)